MDIGSTQACCSVRREPRREWGFCSGSETSGGIGCPSPFESSLFLSFDRALGLLLARLGVGGSTSPEDSPAAVAIAAVIVVEGVVAEEMG